MPTMKERLLETMRGNKTDRPPCICPGGMMNLVTREIMEQTGVHWPETYTDPRQMAKLASAACALGCFENYGLPFCMTAEVEGIGARVTLAP